MKTSKLAALLLMSLTLTSFAQASGTIANGGDAVVCYTDATKTKIKSVQMFDYWEQDKVLHYPGGIDLGAQTLSVQDKIKLVTKRIAKFDPNLANKVNQAALAMANNIASYLVTDVQLPEIDDANPKVIPNQPHCFIEQYAVQWVDISSGIRRFAIADKFYNHVNTSNDSKAGILLHEALFRQAVLLGSTNSDGIRVFNYLASTKKLDQMTGFQTDEYFKLVQDANLNLNQCQVRAPAEPDKPYLRFNENIYVSNKGLTCFNQDLKVGPDYISIIPGLDVDSQTGNYQIGGYNMIIGQSLPMTYHRYINGIFEHIQFMRMYNRSCTYGVLSNTPMPFECDNAANKITLDFVLTETPNNFFNVINVQSTASPCITSQPGYYYDFGGGAITLDRNTAQVTECRVNISTMINNKKVQIKRISSKHTNGLYNFQFDGFALLEIYGTKTHAQLATSNTYLDDNYRIVLNHWFYDDERIITVNNDQYILDECDDYEGRICDLSKGISGVKTERFLKHTSGLRFLMTGSKDASAYCASLGYGKEKEANFWYRLAKPEYLINPESFYDLSTKSILNKSDEEVEVATIRCIDTVSKSIINY